ncbi:MAG: ribonuclease J [Candidatus Buchananbacteria bacterium CG10_big_fil_rev_8_21_14_0_10_42_9]|uniref:Ribonuclease J n=1 Tax=Candidatus Buchananbacteria bacterium CG10_big_fil_rev_8_21_14_0_10_42_9 TaxID=1974526 RepID=A0A2H0W1D7_9BACT|nr:MAG: ribonuclease J [Candidatus Buchananbacteria bacterium CG10_big_fil_rev_8_21_14_0_10_42_9]
MVTKKNAARPASNKQTSSKATTKRTAKPTRQKSRTIKKPGVSTGEKQTVKSGKLNIIPVGGFEEVGRNCVIFEYGNDIIIVDLGLQFPEEEMHGIDYIIPDLSYLKGKEKNIRGVLITHGHYDHIGAVPHVMKAIGNPPIYTGDLTAGIIKKRQEEYKEAPPLKLQVVRGGDKVRLGCFDVEFVPVNHNIPNSFAILIRTPVGNIIHTGDFKLDKAPINDAPVDLQKFALIGAEGILALMADSTNAWQKGHQLSETEVGVDLEKLIENAKGRMIIGTFASLLSRIQQILTLAEKHGRKVMFEGRSIKTNVEVAKELGYLKFDNKTIVEQHNFKDVDDDKLIIICTGAQGEKNAVLMRIAEGNHRFIKFKSNDTVIFSSSVIPGNERTVQNLQDAIYRYGASVVNYKMLDVHAGGHAKEQDIKLLLQLVRPKYFIPIEGNHFMLRINGQNAKIIGLKDEHIIVAENGQVIEADKEKVALTQRRISTEYVFVDGLGVGDVSHIVLRDRKLMAEDGMIVIIATIYKKSGEPVQNPDIISRGFVYMRENKKLIEDVRHKVKSMLKETDNRSPAFENYIKERIRNEIGQYVYSKTHRRPMVLPVLIEV